jgi:hypothetical protein
VNIDLNAERTNCFMWHSLILFSGMAGTYRAVVPMCRQMSALQSAAHPAGLRITL